MTPLGGDQTAQVADGARLTCEMWTPMPDSLHIRLTPAVRRHLERLADAKKTTLSSAMRSAVMQASPSQLEGVPSERELLELLGEAARAGSVPAMRELLAYHQEAGRGKDSPLSVVDELARRRVDGA